MTNFLTMLAVSASVMVASQVAMAQSPVPVANMPKQCQELARKGFKINSELISRSGTAATTPRAGSFGPSRKYGEAGQNKWFVDSFPAHPKAGCRICGVHIGVKGTVGGANDSIAIIGSNTAQPQIAGTPLAAVSAHTRLASVGPIGPVGPFSNGIMIEGPAYMSWYMGSLVPSLDVLVQDDSTISQVEVTYFYY